MTSGRAELGSPGPSLGSLEITAAVLTSQCVGPSLPLQKGSPQYQLLTVPEHSPRGTLVGNVTGAVDADEGPNAIVYYFIAGGAWWGLALPPWGWT